MVDVWLPYGKTEACVRIPTRNFLGLIEPAWKSGVPDASAEIKRALKNPIGSETLGKIVEPNNNIAIVVDDATRPAPSNIMVPPILEELFQHGVKKENVTVIFGCGTHRSVTEEETQKLLGEEIMRQVKVVSHNCRSDDLVHVGKTRTRRTDVYLNRIFSEADVKILTGDICFHYYAGFGGGRKSVLPAVAGEKTIRQNHILLLHPQARTGVLEGNPVHEDMVEAAKLVNVDFLLNVAINGQGEIVKAFAGDVEKAFNMGVKFVDEMYRVQVERRADIVVVSPGGYPSDVNLFQAYKGIDNALQVVKRGGVIVVLAECPEGHGNQVFHDWMVDCADLKAVEKRMKRRFVLGGHKAYYLIKALKKAHLILVSSMPDYYAQAVFKLKTARAVNDALDEAFSITKKSARVLAIPYGNFTLPEVRENRD
ncbi:MAG: nickel-dependent lactate racemase [Candidatus Bathyarchaeota archaeon]|jgi:nickel-dependent lactate racemase